MKYTECIKCHKFITNNNIIKHQQSCKGITNHYSYNDIDDKTFICQYCGKQCKNLNSLKNHELRCNENPNKIETHLCGNKGHKGCNQYIKAKQLGLLKPVISQESRINRSNNTKRLWQNSNYRKLQHDKAIKQKLGGYHLNGHRKSIKGWYKGFHCDSTYELVYLIYCLDHNINIKKCDKVYKYFYENKYHKYYPDFIINNDTIIEIKNYYNEVVNLKAQSVTDMKYQILYKKDLQKEFNYVYETYNVNDKTIQTLYE